MLQKRWMCFVVCGVDEVLTKLTWTINDAAVEARGCLSDYELQ